MKFLLVCLSLATIFSVQAADLKNAKNLYESLVKSFPGALEYTGGFSTAIELTDLSCAASVEGRGPMKYECHGTNVNGKRVSNFNNAKNLFSSMFNSGAALDTTSEAATMYVVFNKILCERLECKPTRPNDCKNVKVKYSCQGEI